MKMLTTISTTIFWLTLAVLMFLYMSETKITFNPFTFKVLYVSRGIGWVLIVIGLVCLEFAAKSKGREELRNEVSESIDDLEKTQEETDSIYNKAVKILDELEKDKKTQDERRSK